MGKKLPNIAHFKNGNFNNNIPSVNKAKKLNNKFSKKKKKNKHKKHKNNENDNIFNFNKKDKISNNLNFTINNITNNKNVQNFIFNSFYNNKKEKEKEKPEWMSAETQKIQNINSRFNSEIYEYVNYIIPKNYSLSQRQNTKQRLINIIRKYQPQWKIFLFGSFSQNTSTVFSDLDFAIISDADSSRKKDLNELIYIMKILRNDGFSRNIRLIKARVPILKATCSLTGINVDISVNRDNGYKAARIIRNILGKYKVLKPTIIILKILLKNNNLNDAHTGGMSSFLLFHLVYFFYITYQKRIQNGIYNNINVDNNDKEVKENNKSVRNNKNNDNLDNIDEEGEEDEDDYEEDKEMSLDSNSDVKWDNKIKKYNSHGIIVTKGASSTDEEEYSNDDSNIVKNGNSSSNSEEDPKYTEKHTNYKNNNFRNYNKNDYEEEEDDDDEDDEDNEDEDYLTKNIEEEKNSHENDNTNIGHFFFNFLKFYGKEFDYRQLGFSLNENNFGETFFKVERSDMDCSDNICAESIQEQSVDVGKACYNYPKIAYLFKSSYDKIKIEKQRDTCSILQCLDFPTI